MHPPDHDSFQKRIDKTRGTELQRPTHALIYKRVLNNAHRDSLIPCACALICEHVLNNAHRDSKHCKCVASLHKHIGKLESAVTFTLGCESKFPKVKSLVTTHSACPCKNDLLKCSQPPRELIYFVFFYLVCNFYLVYNKAT